MAHSKNNGLPITDRMREAYQLVTIHGTREAAAAQMGVTTRAVSMLVVAYCDRAGVPPPYRGSRPYALANRLVAAADARAAESEAEVAHLSRELAEAHARIRDLETRLAARPLPFVADHRRVADGGRSVRQQRREHRRAA